MLDLSDEELYRFIEDLLARGNDVRIRVTGQSMLPTLADNDRVVVRRVIPSALRPGAIILFKDRFNQLVLHRLLRITQGATGERMYQARGDHLLLLDMPVSESDVLGYVAQIEKGSDGGGLRNTQTAIAQLRDRLRAYIALFQSALYYKVYRKLKVN